MISKINTNTFRMAQVRIDDSITINRADVERFRCIDPNGIAKNVFPVDTESVSYEDRVNRGMVGFFYLYHRFGPPINPSRTYRFGDRGRDTAITEYLLTTRMPGLYLLARVSPPAPLQKLFDMAVDVEMLERDEYDDPFSEENQKQMIRALTLAMEDLEKPIILDDGDERINILGAIPS
uniref:Uncharacterized protein n=1 Tax=Candidatus Kentrum sp. TC TaxID=2126339 RepID=A0A450YYI1_9GAMM|nr:MAG: hypothetical protein BECKTC1821E_GA0114239_10676 [Candidatus Kentron sp. TC]